MSKSTSREPSNAPRTASAKLREKSLQHSNTKTKSRLPIVIGAFTVVILLCGVFAIGRFTAPSSSTVQDNTSAEQVERSVSGETVEADQKNSMKAAQKLLDASATEGGDYKSRMSKVESGDLSSVTDEMKSGIYLSKGMDNDDARASTYQSLIALNGLLLEGKKATPASEDAWQSVQVDSENGIAYVPLGIFTGQNVPFSFEMVYVDGQWKLAPYSLLQAIQMSSTVNTNSNG